MFLKGNEDNSTQISFSKKPVINCQEGLLGEEKSMKNKKIIPIITIILCWCFFPISLRPVSADWAYIYKYLSDDAIKSSGTQKWVLGDAKVRATDMDNLGVYTETSTWLCKAKSWIEINGGHYDADPWTFPSTLTYYWTVKWVITGNYDESASNYFFFDYGLYYMSGDVKVYVDTLYYEYTADFNYNSQTVGHYGGSVYLYSGTTYYLECNIELYHSTWSGYSESDMWSGSNEIDFTYAEFRYITS